MPMQKTDNDRPTPTRVTIRSVAVSGKADSREIRHIDRIGVLTAARAAALFTSGLSGCSDPSRVEVAAAIRHAVRTYGGTRGCAGEVAAAYGEHPETAVLRMRWARRVIEATYPPGGAVTVPVVAGTHRKARVHGAAAQDLARYASLISPLVSAHRTAGRQTA